MTRNKPTLFCPDRRQLLQCAGLGGLGLFMPRPLWADSTGETKFLFVYCRGGWDTSLVFTPLFDTEADTEPDSVVSEVGGLPFVDNEWRPNVRSFFESYGDQVAVINGIEVPSIIHERCRQLLLTGRSDGGADDWGSQLAAASSEEPVLPHLVLAGPSYTHALGDRVVRVGNDAQLQKLLDGTALLQNDHAISSLPESSLGQIDAFVRARTVAARQSTRARSDFADAYASALADMDELRAQQHQIDLTPQTLYCTRDLAADFETALSCFEMGLSRCAMVQYNGWCDQGWDTHQNQALQTDNFEELMGALDSLMESLETRSGPSGGTLRDEVVVVVCSEMGRHPKYNDWGGRDHWTYTSVMLFGGGVQGGRVLGGLDEAAQGEPIDLASGNPDSAGVALSPAHVGATLMALGGVDPDEDPIEGVIA